MMHWLPKLSDVTGLQVNSPVSGAILPLSMHPDLLYNANVLPQALVVKLEDGTLFSPFSCQFSSQLLASRRVCFTHKSGLTMQLDLPTAINQAPGCAVKQLVPSNTQVAPGKAVIKLDLQLLPGDSGHFAVLMILPHPAISAVFSAQRFVDAVKDTAITIQINNR